MQKNSVHLPIIEILNGGTALTPNSGDKIFAKIDAVLNNHQIALVDFSKIDYMTTAFLNAAIGQLYSKYTSEVLNAQIKLDNLSPSDKIMLRKVIERAKSYFADKDNFENTLSDNL